MVKSEGLAFRTSSKCSEPKKMALAGVPKVGPSDLTISKERSNLAHVHAGVQCNSRLFKEDQRVKMTPERAISNSYRVGKI